MEKSEKSSGKKKKRSIFSRLSDKKLELFVFFLTVALTVVILWPYATTTIDGGFVGAYYSKFFGGTRLDKSYGEGIHFVWPWDSIISYDARAQSKQYSVTTLARGGLKVNVDMSVIWYINGVSVGELHSTMGPEYAERVIDPAVMSTVRSTIGNYEQDELYDGDPLMLQQDVMKLLSETLANAPFTIHSILIREVALPDKMADAISDKFVAEQNVLAERYRVLESVERYKRTYVTSEGVRISQSVVNDGMSEAYLRFLGIEATKELAQSDNAKLVIIGDKDGLPLILNPDTLSESETLPEGVSPDDYIKEEGKRMGDLVNTYNSLQQNLKQMSDVLGELLESFPEANGSLDDSDTIPQVNRVPTFTEETEETEENE